MIQDKDQITKALAEAERVKHLPHVVVDENGNPVGEPFPNRRAALMDALHRNGMAGKGLYDVRPIPPGAS